MICGDHVIALGVRNGTLKFGECFGKNPAAPILIEPAKLSLRGQKNAAQDQGTDSLRIRFRVGKRQRRSPRAAEKLPAVDIEFQADAFDVVDQILRRVAFDGCVRHRPATTALIEKHDPVFIGIVKPAHRRITAAAWTAVHDQRRLASGISALLDIKRVAAADRQPALPIRSDRWIKIEPVSNGHGFAAFDLRLGDRYVEFKAFRPLQH